MKYFIRLSYNGAPFSGWQIQKNANSVQEELQKAFSTLLKEKIEITGAGRTDSGVNAANYIAHTEISSLGKNPAEFLYKINAILPKEIAVKNIFKMPAAAHARFDAVSRTYKYFLTLEKEPFNSAFTYFYRPGRLDFEAMNKAARFFIGEQDFTSLEKLHSGSQNAICNVTEAVWERIPAHSTGSRATIGDSTAGSNTATCDGGAPCITPYSTLHSAPCAIPSTTLHTAPRKTPCATLHTAPCATSCSTLHSAPCAIPSTTLHTAPCTTPCATLHTAPCTTSCSTLHSAPCAIPSATLHTAPCTTPCSTPCSTDIYVFTVTSNRFLRNMVRAMVGSLLEVGSGKRKPEWIAEMLRRHDRCAAGFSVPGNALFLTEIRYPYPIK